MTYSYDMAGRRTTIGGTYASTGLPNAQLTTAYDSTNELTTWGTATPTYDANGNVLSDGTNSYVWNARNQLASMNMSAQSFQYDSLGRRATKTILSATTTYLYDGVNPVQELSGVIPTASLLTGGMDEYFQRTDSTGAANFLVDALGSSVAITNSSGSNLARYTYDPFGNTTITGSSANPYQYTGRENDGTDVYFYRGRYYSQTFQRFISEDPIGFRGGFNRYAYVNNNPISFSDPFGFCPATAQQRWQLAEAGLWDLAIGGIQAVAPIALAPETGGLSLLDSYGIYSGTMKAAGGLWQLGGAISGDLSSGESGGQFFNGMSTLSGALTLSLGGSGEDGEAASSLEGLALFGASGAADSIDDQTIPDPFNPPGNQTVNPWGSAGKAADALDNAAGAAALISPNGQGAAAQCGCH